MSNKFIIFIFIYYNVKRKKLMLDILLDKIILNYKFIFIYYDIKKTAKKLMSQTAY